MTDICSKCGSPLAEIVETKSGRQLQRCSTGGWDAAKRQATGCRYVEWLKPGDPTAQAATGEEFLPPEPAPATEKV